MVTKLTTDNFEAEVLKNEKPVLVDFYADWCGPCRMMGPLVEKISDEMKDQIKVGKVNVDENQELAVKYGVQSIPMLIVFKNGAVAGSTLGLQSEEDLKAVIQKVL